MTSGTHGERIPGAAAAVVVGGCMPRSGVTVAALVNLQAGPEDRGKRRLAQELVATMRSLAP